VELGSGSSRGSLINISLESSLSDREGEEKWRRRKGKKG
jgi:hypothetical protein